MDKRYLAVTVLVTIFLIVVYITVSSFLLPGTVPTEVKPAMPVSEDPLELQGRIWELTDENELLNDQVFAYEDIIATVEENEADAIDMLTAAESELEQATRPIIVEDVKGAQIDSQAVSGALPQPPLIPEWNE